MAETALNFGPDWIRAYSAGATSSANPTSAMPIPKYSLAEFRYGREEMLALIPKDIKLPACLKGFPHLVRDKFQMPLALIPITEEEQRLWTRVNSDAALRASGKTVSGMGRTGRGGSVDRGRGRGRGGYYQRGVMHDDSDDNIHGFSRPKQVERSLSANERDQRWEDRERRYERPYSSRGNATDDGFLKQENTRAPHDYWRKYDKDDDGDWRSSGSRSSDRIGGRGSWRNASDRDRREMSERNLHSRNNNSRSGPSPHKSHHSWKEPQNTLPEWSVEEANESETVGTFDSSGAFLETKTTEDTSSDEIYNSDKANEGSSKDSPEANRNTQKKLPKPPPNSGNNKTTNKKKANNSPAVERSKEEKPAQVINDPPKNSSKDSKTTAVSKSVSNVIRTHSDPPLPSSEKEPEFQPDPNPHVPNSSPKNSRAEEVALLSSMRNSENATPTSGTAEEDAFAHHKKATENMVAQWTEEEEQQAISQTVDIHPPHETETKWFYQDPQGDIQGPFASAEMLEWFSAGYFTVNLMVRRHCDEQFSKLGDIIKAWDKVPFLPGTLPPPIRVSPLASSIPAPMSQTNVPNPAATATSAQIPKQEELLALQRQLYQQQLMQQQLIMRQQAQMQALLTQLKQQDNFSSMTSQQQQQVLLQHVMTQQQMPRPNINPLADQPPLLDPLSTLPLPLLGLSMPPVMNDMSLWNTASSAAWPMNLGSSQPPGSSIWDIDLLKSNPDESEAEKQKRKIEEHEKLRKAEELRLEQEREEKRLHEELRRKQEEAKLLQELQKQEEEKRKLEELKRQQEEERRRLEELRLIEEKKRQEEELKRQEELRREEELRQQEELRKQELQRLEELKRQEELRKQEELRRQEELQKQEEEQRQQEEIRKKEEQRRQEELRKQQEKKLEEKRKKEEMLQEEKRKQMEREKEKQLELEKQKEALRLKEIEREERYQAEKKEKEELELVKLAAELKLRTQGPVWGIQNSQQSSELSLADIQRLQEEKEREERQEKLRQQSLQQQAVKQVQQNKNGLSWAKRATESQPAVKSLIEIQQEEAERLALMQRTQKPQPPPPTLNSNVGVWGNTSHLNKITAPPQTWNTNNVSSSTGFWDDVISSNSHSKKQPQKTNETGAFPALANRVQPATVNSNKSKNVRAKKEEDAVARIFGAHTKPTDEFTKWCTEAISTMPSSVDVPTFVAFLKDIESPYEVYDYVKSYLGEGKEPREFAKQFLEKRSKFRNQAKQTPAEDNTLWGPAPAITPTVNKPTVQNHNDNDGNSNAKGKAKRRKNRMQKLDNSMLGFTVQSNPDRVNVGEIDHIDGV